MAIFSDKTGFHCTFGADVTANLTSLQFPSFCDANAHPKAAFALRSRAMVERSNLILLAINHPGGAHEAMRYAQKLHKPVWNLLDSESV